MPKEVHKEFSQCKHQLPHGLWTGSHKPTPEKYKQGPLDIVSESVTTLGAVVPTALIPGLWTCKALPLDLTEHTGVMKFVPWLLTHVLSHGFNPLGLWW